MGISPVHKKKKQPTNQLEANKNHKNKQNKSAVLLRESRSSIQNKQQRQRTKKTHTHTNQKKKKEPAEKGPKVE